MSAKGLWSIMKEAAETLIIALVLTFFIRSFLVESIEVQGFSMEPTLHDGERLLINKLVYRIRPPRQGEIIVFKYPRQPDRDFIKRVIAGPGQQIEIRTGRVFVDGNPLKEDYLTTTFFGDLPPVEVPKGHVFVMGDNRGNSEDSRSFGPVSLEMVKGRAFLIFWPLPRMQVIGAGE